MTRMTDLEKVQTPEEEAARAAPETANTATIQVGDTVVALPVTRFTPPH